jgi:hypothetical protein
MDAHLQRLRLDQSRQNLNMMSAQPYNYPILSSNVRFVSSPKRPSQEKIQIFLPFAQLRAC